MTTAAELQDITFTVEIEEDGFIVGQVNVPGDCETELVAYLVQEATNGATTLTRF